MPVFSESTIIWIALAALFFIVEGATFNLISIWFAIGALAALIASAMDASIMIQLTVFTAVSFITLLLTRPLVNKIIHQKKVATNSERNIGKTATVICDISPEVPGRVRLDGVDWSARSQHNLSTGSLCVISAIESTTLVVEPQPAKAAEPVKTVAESQSMSVQE